MRSRTGVAAIAVAAAIAALPACAPVPPSSMTAERAAPPADFPEAFYRQAAAQGQRVFRVDAAASLVVIEVGRSGSLARLGHDHVVAARTVGGYVAPEARRADLYVRLDDLTVDEPALRAEAGFDRHPTETDIAGTRANMLNKVLEADRFPYALVRVTGVGAGTGGTDANADVTLTLHGVTRTLPAVPVQVEAGSQAIAVSGRLSFDQTDFGIVPYSVFEGALAVRNRVDLRFRVRAAAVSAP